MYLSTKTISSQWRLLIKCIPTPKIISPKKPVNQQMTNGVYKTQVFLCKRSQKLMHTVHHWSLFLFIYVILLFQKCCTPSPLAKNGRCHTTSLPLSYTPKVAIVEKFGHIMLINFIIPGIGHQMIEMLGIC